MIDQEDLLADEINREVFLPDWIKAGESFRDRTNPNCPILYHIRGVVDDRVVMRVWNRSKNRWVYFVEDPYFFFLRRETLQLLREPSVPEKSSTKENPE